MKNYIKNAKTDEAAFRLILDKFKINDKDLSIEEIYSKYSKGDRYGIWTITNFEKKDVNVFEFSYEDIATLSGISSTNLYTIEDNEIKSMKNISFWMS